MATEDALPPTKIQQGDNQKVEEKAWTLRQSEVNYTALSSVKSKACATCRWFNPYGDYHDEIPIANCHLVDNWPETILATGYCDRHEAKPVIEPPKQEPIPVMIVEPEEVVEMAVGSASSPFPPVTKTEKLAYATPAPPSGLIPAVKRLLGREQPITTIERGTDGLRYMVIFTSNGYEDRDEEHVATRALAGYVKSCWLPDGAWVGTNKHLYWHDNGLEIGAIVWADMIDGFLVEVSRELDTPIAKAIWDYIERGDELHGASHGFRINPKTKEGNTYTVILKHETSSLPVAAASNIGTLSEVITTMETKEQRLDKIFGIEGAAKILAEKGPKGLNDELAKRGVTPKSANSPAAANVDEPTSAEKNAQKQEENFSLILMQTVEAVADIYEAMSRSDEVRKTSAETDKAARDATNVQLAALQDSVKKLETQMSLTPRRASSASETQLTAEQIAAMTKDQEEVDPWFPPDMQVVRPKS